MATRKLALGVGEQEYNSTWETLDRVPEADPDTVWDLETGTLPYRSNRFELVKARHVLEHLTRHQLHDILEEINRVAVPGAEIRITGPHMNSRHAAALDHPIRGFSRISFDVYTPSHSFVNQYPDLFEVENVEYMVEWWPIPKFVEFLFGRKAPRFLGDSIQEIKFKLRNLERE